MDCRVFRYLSDQIKNAENRIGTNKLWPSKVRMGVCFSMYIGHTWHVRSTYLALLYRDVLSCTQSVHRVRWAYSRQVQTLVLRSLTQFKDRIDVLDST